jgi:PhnB protein
VADKVKPIPEGYHSVTPYLIVKDAAQAIEFYKKAFGAIESLRQKDAGGKIRHAEIKIGDSTIMMADEFRELAESPADKSPRVHIHLYVEDADAVFKRAVEAGATVLMPLTDQAYGDRSGGVTDPLGQTWYIATHVKDVH